MKWAELPLEVRVGLLLDAELTWTCLRFTGNLIAIELQIYWRHNAGHE